METLLTNLEIVCANRKINFHTGRHINGELVGTPTYRTLSYETMEEKFPEDFIKVKEAIKRMSAVLIAEADTPDPVVEEESEQLEDVE